MKLIKIVILSLLLFSSLSIGAFAEHLPEEDIIGKDMIIEKDSNIVKDSIEADKNPEFIPKYEAVKMTKTVFFTRYTRPAIILLISGGALFGVVTFLENRKENEKKSR